MSEINKYGLSRYVEAAIARLIREEAGYGCVICGALFADYEHIDPEFHEARSHDASKMTLLCGTHHDDVSHYRIHKDDVWDAKRQPYNKREGAVSSRMYHQTETSKIYFGSNAFGSGAVNKLNIGQAAISLYGKPILWFENSDGPNSPIKTCAIFYHKDKKPCAFINRNIFKKEIDEYDIQSIMSRVEIRRAKRDIALKLNFPGRGELSVEYFRMEYENFSVFVDSNGDFNYTDSSGTNLVFSGTSIGALSFSKIPETNRDFLGVRSQLSRFVEVALYGVKIISFNGFHLGWMSCEGLAFNKEYKCVGQTSDGDGTAAFISTLAEYNFAKVYSSLTASEETVYFIAYENDSYDSGEPIWVCHNDKVTKNIRSNNLNDLGYRLFDVPNCYN
ncbi:HNH endonuclease signature motif containing protein [Klebsiella pneumoniae]|uniref:HNH endonuclease signature motif containing protein n=1 Tax=Klebsiella pneumoniae TaxID=573 RepID=UPI001B8C9F65|nr:HNH endonuclease signature motif containing protein [Klebsiella pneumoniae]MBR7384187.1 HNH endonuclease [Klebsiella pneumoniae]